MGVCVACGGRFSDSGPGTATNRDLLNLPITTPAAVGEPHKITWALYRDINGLDPVVAFDYSESRAHDTCIITGLG